MRMSVTLEESDILEAVKLYMKQRGYSVTSKSMIANLCPGDAREAGSVSITIDCEPLRAPDIK